MFDDEQFTHKLTTNEFDYPRPFTHKTILHFIHRSDHKNIQIQNRILYEFKKNHSNRTFHVRLGKAEREIDDEIREDPYMRFEHGDGSKALDLSKL